MAKRAGNLRRQGSWCWALNNKKCKVTGMLNHFRNVQLFATLWTVAHQAPLSMGILQEKKYLNGLLCPPPGNLPDLGIKTHICLHLQHCRQILYPLSNLGSPCAEHIRTLIYVVLFKPCNSPGSRNYSSHSTVEEVPRLRIRKEL